MIGQSLAQSRVAGRTHLIYKSRGTPFSNICFRATVETSDFHPNILERLTWVCEFTAKGRNFGTGTILPSGRYLLNASSFKFRRSPLKGYYVAVLSASRQASCPSVRGGSNSHTELLHHIVHPVPPLPFLDKCTVGTICYLHHQASFQ